MLTRIFTTNLINIMKKETTATKAPKTTKRAYTKTNVEEAPKQQEVVTVEETEEETKEEVEEVEQPVNKYGIPRTGLPKFTERIPDETLAIALLVKNNAEVKRFTALNILLTTFEGISSIKSTVSSMNNSSITFTGSNVVENFTVNAFSGSGNNTSGPIHTNISEANNVTVSGYTVNYL